MSHPNNCEIVKQKANEVVIEKKAGVFQDILQDVEQGNDLRIMYKTVDMDKPKIMF